MSDSGRQIGDCRHNWSANQCVLCLSEENARLMAENERLHREVTCLQVDNDELRHMLKQYDIVTGMKGLP